MVISFVDIPVINFHAWCGVKINIFSYSLEYMRNLKKLVFIHVRDSKAFLKRSFSRMRFTFLISYLQSCLVSRTMNRIFPVEWTNYILHRQNKTKTLEG